MNPSSKRFQKRVISSWTLAVEKVNLVFVVFCNMLVIDFMKTHKHYPHRQYMCCIFTLGTPKIPSESVGGCLELKFVSLLFDLENIFYMK